MVSATIDVKNEKGDEDERREKYFGTEKVTLEGKECSALAPKVMNEGNLRTKSQEPNHQHDFKDWPNALCLLFNKRKMLLLLKLVWDELSLCYCLQEEEEEKREDF